MIRAGLRTAAGAGIGLALATGLLVIAIFATEAARLRYADEPAAQLAGIVLVLGFALGGATRLTRGLQDTAPTNARSRPE